MKTIAVISQKGGAGKTTIALNLAVAAVRSGHQSAVIDIDPQASAKCWHDLRQDEAPVVVSVQAARLPEILDCGTFMTECTKLFKSYIVLKLLDYLFLRN